MKKQLLPDGTKKIVASLRVINPMGLHTRPATTIVKMLRNVRSHVHFTYKKETINAKSILSILMLAVKRNAQLTVTVVGIDAEETWTLLKNAFDTAFDEEV